jgi:hypothetical protein
MYFKILTFKFLFLNITMKITVNVKYTTGVSSSSSFIELSQKPSFLQSLFSIVVGQAISLTHSPYISFILHYNIVCYMLLSMMFYLKLYTESKTNTQAIIK